MVIARVLTSDGYGVASLLRTIFTTLAMVAPLGLDVGLLKYCGRADIDEVEKRQTIASLRLIAFIASSAVVATTIAVCTTDLVSRLYDHPGLGELLILTIVGLPFAADNAIMGALYKANGRAAQYSLLTVYLQTAVRLVLISATLFTSVSVSYVICINTVQIVMSSICLVVNHRKWDRLPSIKGKVIAAKICALTSETVVILRESGWMALTILIFGSMRTMDVLFLGANASASSVGEYTALATIAQLIQFYPLAASQSLGPNISRMHHNGDVRGVTQELAGYVKRASMIAGFLFAGLAVFGGRLDLLFGPSFHFSPIVCLFLPLGQVIAATLAPTGYALSMTGRHRQETFILLAGAVLMLGCCSVLIPVYGQIGAAVSVCITFFFTNVIRYVYVSRVLGAIPGSLMDFIPPLCAVCLALMARWLGDVFGERTILTTAFSCIGYATAYLAVIMFCFQSSAERDKIVKRLTSFSKGSH